MGTDYRCTEPGYIPRTSITSNGLSLAILPDDYVKRFHSVEFSLDFPTEREHDAFRGPGNWRAVQAGIERCGALGVPITVTTVMMRINHGRLGELARVAAAYGANLRVNVYQPSKSDRFTLTNFGDVETTVFLERAGDFFTFTPEQFSLPGGASRVVTLRSESRPAGRHDGNIIATPTAARGRLLLAVRRSARCSRSGTDGDEQAVLPRSP